MSYAQSSQRENLVRKDNATLILTENKDSFSLGPRSYITKDNDGSLDAKLVFQRHIRNLRGTAQENPIINLGITHDRHWMVVTVRNDSQTEDWNLKFGTLAEGRMGLVRQLFVYDAVSNKIIFNGVNPKNKTKDQVKMQGPILPITLKKGRYATLMIFMTPDGSLPMAFHPILEKQETESSALPFNFNDRIATWVLIALIGLFIGLSIVDRTPSYLTVSLFFTCMLTVFISLNIHFFLPNFRLRQMTVGCFGLSLLSLIWMSKEFLQIKMGNQTESLIMGSLVITVVLCFGINLLVAPEHALLQRILSMLPFTITLITVIGMSFFRMQDGVSGAAYFGLACLSLFVGYVTTSITVLGYLQPEPHYFNAFWYALPIQGIFLIFATERRHYHGKRTVEQDFMLRSREALSVARIKESRESADQARLLRILERERELMSELREEAAKRSEEMRVAKVNADSANRAKSAFLAVVSHEIRTPMTGILGMVRLLLNTRLSKEQNDYAKTILDSGDAMLALLNDILDFSKIESGKMDLEEVSFDLPRMVNSVIMLMSGHANEKNIQLNTDMSNDIPEYVYGDPTRLRQVLLNLVGNAIKFTSKGGVTLTVRLMRQSPPTSEHGRAYSIYFGVQDSGIGITKKAQKTLFDPFSQADTSISRKFGGTGLGLAICLKLIEAMGSMININSTPGEGSTFFFTLDMIEGNAHETADAGGSGLTQSVASDKRLKILVVDDNEINRKVLNGLLEPTGHDIRMAEDGEQAIEKALARKFDVILMDVNLPGKSGIEATQEIRAHSEQDKANVPIISMTANVLQEDIDKCLVAGMDAYLAKPIDPSRLQEILSKVTTGEIAHNTEQPETTQTSPAAENVETPASDAKEQKPVANTQHDERQKSAEIPQEPIPSHNANEPEPLPLSEPVETEPSESNLAQTSAPPSNNETVPNASGNPHEQAISTPAPQPTQETTEVIPTPSHEKAAIPAAAHIGSPRQERPTESLQTVSTNAAEESNHTPSIPDEPESLPDINEVLDSTPKKKKNPFDNDRPPIMDIIEAQQQAEEKTKQAEKKLEETITHKEPIPTIDLPVDELPQVPPEAPAAYVPQPPPKAIQTSGDAFDPAVFDAPMLESLRDSLGAEQMKELIDGLLEKTDEILDTMKDAYLAQDMDSLKSRGHELKGMTANFGLIEVAEVSSDIEQAAKDNNMDAIHAPYKNLPDAVENAREILGKWLGE